MLFLYKTTVPSLRETRAGEALGFENSRPAWERWVEGNCGDERSTDGIVPA